MAAGGGGGSGAAAAAAAAASTTTMTTTRATTATAANEEESRRRRRTTLAGLCRSALFLARALTASGVWGCSCCLSMLKTGFDPFGSLGVWRTSGLWGFARLIWRVLLQRADVRRGFPGTCRAPCFFCVLSQLKGLFGTQEVVLRWFRG